MTELEFLTPGMLKTANFMTFTCKEAETADTVRRGWHRVQAWMMRHGYVDYLVTSAIQSKRFKTYGDAVVHYHVIVFGHSRMPREAIFNVWGLGWVQLESARNSTHAIRYVASYIRGNNGRLSWSTHLLSKIPGGAAPHDDCYRYVRADPAAGFPGGIIDFGWGNVRPISDAYSYVPAVGRIVPSIATTCYTLLWRAYRMSIDWSDVRERMQVKVQAENDFIRAMRLGYDSRACPTVPLRARPVLYIQGD